MIDLILSEYRLLAQDIFAFSICFAALVWGGTPERIVAGTWLLVFELGGRLREWFLRDGVQLTGVDWLVASSDIVVCGVYVWVALYANRNYTLWIAAMQVLATTSHLARGLADPISPVTYAAMFIAPGWLQLIFLAAGLIRHVVRKRRFGKYRDWRITKGNAGFLSKGVSADLDPRWQTGEQPSWREEVK